MLRNATAPPLAARRIHRIGWWLIALAMTISADGVFALALQNDRLFVGGKFFSISFITHTGFAAVDATTGSVLPWQADVTMFSESPFQSATLPVVEAMALGQGRIYVGGIFSGIQHSSHSYIAAFADGVTSVDPAPLPAQERLRVSPNPSSGEAAFGFDAQSFPNGFELAGYDLVGRAVYRARRTGPSADARGLVWNGRDEAGRAVAPGIYFARVRIHSNALTTKLLRIRYVAGARAAEPGHLAVPRVVPTGSRSS